MMLVKTIDLSNNKQNVFDSLPLEKIIKEYYKKNDYYKPFHPLSINLENESYPSFLIKLPNAKYEVKVCKEYFSYTLEKLLWDKSFKYEGYCSVEEQFILSYMFNLELKTLRYTARLLNKKVLHYKYVSEDYEEEEGFLDEYYFYIHENEINLIKRIMSKYIKTHFNKRSESVRYWSLKVKERDNFKCIKCNSEIGLNAHHVRSYKEYPELRTDINNGVTLCKKCHVKIHK